MNRQLAAAHETCKRVRKPAEGDGLVVLQRLQHGEAHRRWQLIVCKPVYV